MRAIFCLFCSSAFASNTYAGLINVDFNDSTNYYPYSGAAMIGSAGDLWNEPVGPTGTAMSLITSSGLTSPVTMDWNAQGAYAIVSYPPPFDVGLARDYLYESSGTGSIVLHNLSPGPYDLFVYAYPGNDGQDRTGYISANGLVPILVGPNNNAGSWQQPVNYVELEPTVAADGLLSISFTHGSGGKEFDVDGFQVQPLPEPASIALLAAAVLGLVGCAWRKRCLARRTANPTVLDPQDAPPILSFPSQASPVHAARRAA